MHSAVGSGGGSFKDQSPELTPMLCVTIIAVCKLIDKRLGELPTVLVKN